MEENLTRGPRESQAVMPPLMRRLPQLGQVSVDQGELLDRFLDYVKEKGLSLYEAQEEAMLALFAGSNVILNTPTGSGKSLVATALNFLSLAQGRRSIYTCPIKALVNEKFLALCKEFGADQVGMITGDATVNRHARIICCTAEILANIALAEGPGAAIDDIIMDEFHYYSDRDRGTAWQVPLLTMPQSRFLLMSATFGDTDFFATTLKSLTGREAVVVKSSERPVPLQFVYQETLLHETIRDLVAAGKAPIYLVNFTQRECAEQAQNLMSEEFSSKEEKKEIGEFLSGFKFSSPYGKDIQRLLRHGVGIHHAGLLPKYRLLVEKLAQKGLLKVICGTDTLGVGVNVPIRTVLFTKLCKFDGGKTAILSVRDFQQISGRAGRRGFDSQGTVVIQAPEHVVENLRMESKASGDPKKLRKMVKKKPPEKGYVHWDVNTFNRLISAPPEALTSSFKVSYGMLLHVLSRPVDGCRSMKNLLRGCHESPRLRQVQTKTAFQMFRALVERKIIEFDYTLTSRYKQIIINQDLQTDFSLNQSLSLYLLDTLKLLDQEAPDYSLDVLSLVESILENPDVILRRQLDRIKTIKMGEMKASGVEYEERIAELEKLEYPKPNQDFIYNTFNAFAAAHPWVGNENIRPKSIARDMYETFQSFDEYIRDYSLQRAEGVLLRYLTEVYKVLIQTVPESLRNDELELVIDFIGESIRGIDSSLLDEWEKMRRMGGNPLALLEKQEEPTPVEQVDVTKDFRGVTIKIRNEVFRLLRCLAAGNYEGAAGILESHQQSPSAGEDVESKESIAGIRISGKDLESMMAPFYDERSEILTDRNARNPQLCQIRIRSEHSGWDVTQIISDPEGLNDWEISLGVSRSRMRETGGASLVLKQIGPVQV